jgi:hypothetical protein
MQDLKKDPKRGLTNGKLVSAYKKREKALFFLWKSFFKKRRKFLSA